MAEGEQPRARDRDLDRDRDRERQHPAPLLPVPGHAAAIWPEQLPVKADI